MKKRYALADVVLRMVIKKADRLVLNPRAAEGFRLAMDALFRQPRLDPKAEIDAVVRLSAMFAGQHELALADGIVDLLAGDARALSVLGISAGRTRRETTKRFTRMVTGASPKVAAPVFGTQAPVGSVKLSNFLQPGRELRRCPPPPAHFAASRGR